MQRYGFDHYGWTKIERPLSIEFYKNWLDQGSQGGMEYLKTHLEMKENPDRFCPQGKFALVIAKPYFPHPYAETPKKLSHLRTALYAQGEDYHQRFKGELEAIAQALKLDYLREEFLCFTDSAPILERDLAYRAGLGWVGKNTCLIHPKKGSLFFIGQILTTLDIDAPKADPVHDSCGSCQRCITICPTGALEQPRYLNATKCISYWTIESKLAAPENLRSKLGDWFFGCDLCQTICPWNEKSQGKQHMLELLNSPDVTVELIDDLRWILQASGREITRQLTNSPLLRARPRGLKRNALVVIGNLRIQELREEVQNASKNLELKDVAQWTLAQLDLDA